MPDNKPQAAGCAVILLNDDYTPMEFVVSILERFCNHTPEQAMQVMLRAHREGRYRIATLPRPDAEAFAAMLHDLARENGHPMQCVVEPLRAAHPSAM